VEVEDTRPEETERRLEEAIGEDGLYLPTTAPSPVQQLIELDVGLANFCYFLQDHPRRMEELLAAMQRSRVQEYEILARRTAAPAVIPVENTSTTLTSPRMYREWSLPQIARYAEVLHGRGKKIILHMCGRLKGLLPVLGETGLDGINGLTPPRVGDVPYEEALDALGEDLVLMGAVFPGEVFQRPGATAGEIHRALDALYTPRIRRARMVLWLGADGLPTPVERFLAVREWMGRNGAGGRDPSR
jgi:uroporphyrinogen-III decarboxylase